MLGEGDTFGISGSFSAPKWKRLILVLVKHRQNFAWVCITIVKTSIFNNDIHVTYELLNAYYIMYCYWKLILQLTIENYEWH